MSRRRKGGMSMSAVEMALSWRARAAIEAEPGDRPGPAAAPSPELLASLRHHLLAGETHYPDRPGMVDLRRLVGAALPGAGYPERGADGVLITASEGESLFVTLLGLGAGKGASYTGSAPGRHSRLFDWMGLVMADPDAADHEAPAFDYTDRAHDAAQETRGRVERDLSAPRIHAIGDPLFRSDAAAHSDDALAKVIVIGSLDGLAAMQPFRLGFVAAPPKTLAGITRWKQASSICSPAPSQRAALFALGVRP
ncbi:MAG: hypothetical protein F4205_00130 [Gemmatimonadetes bacterium]|nr:hypothetical protein [Gemmatimonadota bacterium]MYG33874.1 hypothetical protein [Gemmatimonadota bacterium]